MASADRVAHELQKLVAERLETLTRNISVGSFDTFDKYKLECGKVRGLEEALDLLDEALAIANGKETKG